MQIVENFGTHKQLQSDVVQVTLSNPEEISSVFPSLRSHVETICKDYDWTARHYAESRNQMIIKKCE